MERTRPSVLGGLIPTVLLVILVSVIGAVPASAAVLNVPSPYATIQAAITAAASGDTIVVAAGNYPERLTITKSLDIRGAQYGIDPTPAGARTNPSAESTVDIRGIGVTNPNVAVEIPSGVTGVSLAGFTIYGSPTAYYADEAVIRCWDDGITIRENILDGYYGILFKGNDDFLASGNRITVNKVGLTVQPNAATDVAVSGNLIQVGTSPATDAAGMYLTACTNLTVSGNTASGFTGNNGVGGSNLSHVLIDGNTLANNKKSINIWGSTTFVTITANRLTGCSTAGLNIKGADIAITHNVITGNTAGISIGFHVIPTQRVTVAGNDLSGNTTVGLELTAGVTEAVDASGNWWGSASPSAVRAQANAGTLADYTPWLASGSDLGDPGFQGDYSILWVDDDSPQTSGGRIQEGVDLVSGSTVDVAAGTYEEQVEIAKNLTLDGAGAGATVIRAPATLTKFFATSVNNYPIVYVHGTDGVTVRDLTIDGFGRGNANYRFIGIAYYDAGGLIDDCEVKDVRDTPVGGAQHGVGVYALANLGTPRSVLVSDCDVYGYQKNAMALSGANLTASVNGCEVTGYGPATFIAQNGIQLSGGAQGDIGATEGNTISGHSYTPHDWAASGILIYSLGGPAAVRNNTLTNNSESVYCFDGSVTIEDNTISVATAGTGVHDYWAVICDPGSAGPMPAASPFAEEETRRDGRASFAYAVNRNTIVGDDGSGSVGLDVWCDGTDQASFTAGQNRIRNFDYGVNVDASGTGLLTSVELNWNSIEDNVSYGMYNDYASTGVEVDAENNWWGDAAGPGTKAGNPVSPFVDYDPWVGKDGGGNIVVVNDPEYLTGASPTKTVSVNYLGGGSGLVYGYSMKFSWNGSKVSTAPNKVLQGTLLSSQGTTQFFKHLSGTNEITVDCVLLGDKPGVPGPGTMFTIEFTGLALGTSPVDLTVIKVRDKYNQELTGFYPNDGELIVDLSAPTVADVFIENLTLAHTDDWVKNTDALKVTARVWDDDPAFAKANIRANLSGLGGGASVEPDTYLDSVATWNLASASCTPANGKITVTVTATDPIGNTASGSDDIVADNIAPLAITGLAASAHHQRVALVWSDPSVLDTCYYGVLVRYDGGGDYPEYDALGSYPGSPTGGDGTALNQTGTVTGGNHLVADRDIYYYTAFAYDWALNYGPAASSAEGRATNYWLGDVDAATGPGGYDYDGDVDFDDINVLSNAYWVTGPVWPENECDVGPTEHGGPFDIPEPDEAVEFEDLMVFAMNFNVVSPALKGPGIVLAGMSETGPASLRLAQTPGAAEGEIRLSLVLGGNDTEVKGAGVVVKYDAERLVFQGLTPDAALLSDGVLTFADGTRQGEVRFDWAVLGPGRVAHGSGEVAVLRFAVLDGDGTSVDLEDARIRDAANGTLSIRAEGIRLESGTTVPKVTRLSGAWPNPFNPATIAHFDLNKPGRVTIGVFDSQGRLVRVLLDETRPAGRHEAIWDGADERGRPAGSGAYMIRMRAGTYQSAVKITLVR